MRTEIQFAAIKMFIILFFNQVENFTVSFADGRVLCYLIHHYHPCYVPLEAICQRTTQTVECTKSGTLALNFSSESDDSLNLLNGTFGQSKCVKRGIIFLRSSIVSDLTNRILFSLQCSCDHFSNL